jgi:hypothetical protein
MVLHREKLGNHATKLLSDVIIYGKVLHTKKGEGKPKMRRDGTLLLGQEKTMPTKKNGGGQRKKKYNHEARPNHGRP